MSKPIELDREQSAFVEELLATGRYASAGDVVHEGIALLHAREKRISELRDAWREGVASGDCEPIEGTLDDLSPVHAAGLKGQA